MSADVASIQDRYLYSLSQLATIFGIARETVSKRLQRQSVVPSDERRGHPVYHIASASRAIIEGENPETNFDWNSNPEKMHPKDRKDWYQSEKFRKELEKEDKITIHSAEHELVLSDILKIQLRVMDTLEDMLEREGVEVDVLAKVSRSVDKAKNDLADKLEEYEFKRGDVDQSESG